MVVQPTESGGFALVSVTLMISDLLIQWVKGFLTSEGAWVSTHTCWCRLRFGVDPVAIFSRPFNFNFSRLSPFFASLFKAWHFVGVSFHLVLGVCVVGYSSNDAFVSSTTCKLV